MQTLQVRVMVRVNLQSLNFDKIFAINIKFCVEKHFKTTQI